MYHEKESAISAVLAANALVPPEQFQILQGAIGQEVAMEYHFRRDYSDEADGNTPDDFETIERFILKDVSFVRHPRTNLKYLAFFRNVKDDAVYFPYWSSENVFGDYTNVQIYNLQNSSGEVLWSFNSPGARITTRGNPATNDEIGQAIIDCSESMLALKVKQGK